MKKTVLIILGLIISSLIIGWIAWYKTGFFDSSQRISNIWNQEKTIFPNWDIPQSTENIRKKTGEEIVQDKILQIRKRLALKGLIIEGDRFLSQGEDNLAIKKYLTFYKENPSDSLILEKLWDTYFSIHKYESASSYYEKMPSPWKKYILSIMYITDFSNIIQVNDLIKKIKSVSLSEQEKFYYTTSAQCSIEFHQCKLDFQDFFEILNPQTWEAQEITYLPLNNIKNAIKNYKNFQLDDILLKNAYIIGAWYGDNLFSLTSFLWEKELAVRPDYKPILKIIAQSYFKLWKYEQSRVHLNNYNGINDADAAVAYMLWVVNTQLGEYILANIHFERAIELWYSESVLARRALIYNFYTLDNKDNLLKNLQILIETEDYTQNDASIAIYNHIVYESYTWVEEILPKIQKKFPEDWNIFAYHGWLEREKWQNTKAREILKAWEKLDPNNPFLLINIAYNEQNLWNKWAALIYFKKTIIQWEWTEFSEQAKIEIEQI